MTTTNGQTPAPSRLSADQLTPRDMNRAKELLGDVLAGRSPYDMLEDMAEAVPFTIWCLRTRTDPAFTWDDALDAPFLADAQVGPSRPLTPPPSPKPKAASPPTPTG
jgi:hypothetical protein